MRVWFLTTFEDPRRPDTLKGGYRRCSELARQLRHHVDLRLLNASRQPPGDLSPLADTWVSLVEPSLPRRLALTAQRLLARTRRGDVVYAYNPSIATSPALVAALAGRRLVIDYVDYQGVVTASSLRHRATTGVRDSVARTMVRATRWFTTSSPAIEDEIRRISPDARVHRYYGTLDLAHPGPPAPPAGAAPAAPLHVLYVGSMFPFSGADDAIEAVAALPPGTATIALAGGGPHRAAVEGAVARHAGVARLIEMDDQALHAALVAADVLVLPLRDHLRNRYNFPSRIVEFLWAGRPILATAIPPLRDFLRHGETAWIVPPGGPAALRDGLARLAAAPDLRARLATGARAFFERELAPGPSGAALAAFLSEVAA
jgi:glycosyltransferase involved in cell wall biosynthesis